MALAEVPEFNDIPIEYSEHIEDFYSNDFNIKMKSNKTHLQWKHHEECWSTFFSGVKPEIRKPEKPKSSFKKAIMLVVVVERLKGKKGIDKQSFFDDDDLLNHILIEEDITCNQIEVEDASNVRFQYHRTTVHVIRDNRQKCLVLQEFQENAHLLALSLIGQNIEREAKINVDSFITMDTRKRPVTLCIAGRQLYLCCTDEEGTTDPSLRLKEVADIKEIPNEDLLPFMFYKKLSSSKYNSFESVAFPGYYISTSQQENQQVQLKSGNNQVVFQDFIMNPNP